MLPAPSPILPHGQGRTILNSVVRAIVCVAGGVGRRLLLPGILLSCGLASGAFAQSIVTVAGGGTDDGRPATLAVISPYSVAADASGNLLVGDSTRRVVRKVTGRTGLVSTVAGNGSQTFSGDGTPATLAGIGTVGALAVDLAGNLYLAGGSTYRVVKVDARTGVLSTVAGTGAPNGSWGDGGPATAAVVNANGLAVGRTGNLYLACGNTVRKVDGATGIITTVAGSPGLSGSSGDGGPATAAALTATWIAVDGSENLYLADPLGHRVRKVDGRTGIITTLAGDGRAAFDGDGGPATAAGLAYPQGLALDAAGNVFLADMYAHRVRRVDAATGIITTVAGGGIAGPSGGGAYGGDGGPATAAGLSRPVGVALDPDGNLFVSDSGNMRVRRVDSRSGTITTAMGTGALSPPLDGLPATAAELLGPAAVAVGADGELFFADSGAGRVGRIDPRTARAEVLAGTGERDEIGRGTFGGDGGPATAAALWGPGGVVAGATGNIYISDRYNGRVRKVTGGVITTVAGGGSSPPGDGGPATAASLRPQGLAMSPAGDLLVADGPSNRVVRLDSRTGTLTTAAGRGTGDGGPATAATLLGPYSVAVGPSGDVFVADYSGGRVRRVSPSTGSISTFAGGGVEDPGDGGPATLAVVWYPASVATDRAGNVYFSEGTRVRRVSAETGAITTVAGSSTSATFGDGGPATAAGFAASGIALDAAGNIFIADFVGNRVRKVSAETGIISTVAGSGVRADTGDGGPATQAALGGPQAVAVDALGNLCIGTTQPYGRVRRVSAATGIITTVAGGGSEIADYGPATSVRLGGVFGMAIDAGGNLYIATPSPSKRVWKVSSVSGLIFTAAGGGSGDDGDRPTAASLVFPRGVTVDAAGSLYIADYDDRRVRKVDAATGLITTLAGNRLGPFSGDGGPASMASLQQPTDVAVDPAGNLFVADTSNGRIRRVDAATGTISTVAGKGTIGSFVDGGPATATAMRPSGVAVDRAGDLLVADLGPSGSVVGEAGRIRKVSLRTGTIQAAVGGGSGGPGDGGPATRASLVYPSDVVVAGDGTIYIADLGNRRVRAVFPCRDSLGAFDSSFPGDATLVPGATLSVDWTKADGAFRYDLVIDTAFPPERVVQEDVSGQGFQLSGLAPGRTYFWQVRAKGDPNCPAVARSSGVRRFTVPVPCLAPAAPVLPAPANPASITTLTFAAASGAGSYDLYLGSGPSLPLVAGGLTGTTYEATGLKPGTTYSWRVVGRAACNPDLTSSSYEAKFTVPGGCDAPGAASLASPADGATGISTDPLLSWEPSAGAATYDVHLGDSENPPLLAAGLTASSFVPSGLAPGKTYRWRVVAHASCDTGRTAASLERRFATSPSCVSPVAPAALSAMKTTALLGTPYTLSWSCEDLPPGGHFEVERFRSGDPGSPEVFTTAERSIVLPAGEKTTYSHRVTAISPCGARSAPSAGLVVAVSSAPPFVAMTGPPRATVVAQPAPGLPLPRLEVTVRNTGTSDFLGFFNTAQTVPFFIPSETAVSLRAGEVRIYFLQLSGVPTDKPASYEGLLSLNSADPTDTTAYPLAPVSLRITEQKPGDPNPVTAAPVILKDGQPIDSIAFAPAPESQAPSDVPIDIRNPGTSPLDLVADALPDPWVTVVDEKGEAGWNASPIPPGATRSVRLRAQRLRGAAAGSFPRFTYLTLRTVDGKSTRLLVTDSETIAAGPCRGRSALLPAESSLIVPSIVNAPAMGGGRYVSRLLVTNLGSDPVQADLYYTPDSGDPATDGYDCTKVLQASLLIPGGDVAALTDPASHLFGLESSSGSLEIRSNRIGQLRVQSVVDAPASGGGSFGFQLPTVRSGEGARQGRPYSIVGVVQNAWYRTNVILAETSGQRSSVRLSLYDRTGALVGTADRDLPAFAKSQLPVSELSDGRDLDAGAIEVTATEGSAGSVIAVTTVIDNKTGDASSFVARPLVSDTKATTYAVPSVVFTSTFRSRLEIRNNDTRPVTYRLSYRGSTGAVESQPRTLAPRQEDAWDNVLQDLLALSPGTFGPLAIPSDSPHLQVVSRVYASTPNGTYGDAIEGVALDDPSTTGESGRVLVVDGLEGTADGDRSRGARTNLILTEIAGGTVEVELSLWEKTQMRVAPFARETLRLGPHELLQLNDVFASLDVGQKDRLNVLAMLRPKAGSTGRVTALATRIDNRTNDTKNLRLLP